MNKWMNEWINEQRKPRCRKGDFTMGGVLSQFLLFELKRPFTRNLKGFCSCSGSLTAFFQQWINFSVKYLSLSLSLLYYLSPALGSSPPQALTALCVPWVSLHAPWVSLHPMLGEVFISSPLKGCSDSAWWPEVSSVILESLASGHIVLNLLFQRLQNRTGCYNLIVLIGT